MRAFRKEASFESVAHTFTVTSAGVVALNVKELMKSNSEALSATDASGQVLLLSVQTGSTLPGSMAGVRPGAAQGRGETGDHDVRATSRRENDDEKNSGEEDHEGSRAVAVIFFRPRDWG